MSISAFLFALLVGPGTNEHAKRLYDELLNDYNKLRRPAEQPNERLIIRLKLRLSQIIDVHEKDQIMTSSVWLIQEWLDPKLRWDPMNYGNVTLLYVPAAMIWTPDIVLYNKFKNGVFGTQGSNLFMSIYLLLLLAFSADSTYNITIATKATLHHSGLVHWEPPAVYKSMCPIEVEWFPFDVQTCHLKFGSWSYSEEVLDLQHLDTNVTNTQEKDAKTGEVNDVVMVDMGVDLSEYYPSVEWDIIRIPARRHGKTYPSCCPDLSAYIDITYYIQLRRKPLFYTVNLIFPCVGISFLTIVVFYLPSDSGEKISLCISILVSLTVFFLLLTEIIPATSIVLPLIGKYLLFTMVMVTLSVLVTVLVLNIHFRRPTTHKMPLWVRKLFLNLLPKYLFMRRPSDWVNKSSTKKAKLQFTGGAFFGYSFHAYATYPSSLFSSTLSTPILTPASARKWNSGTLARTNLVHAAPYDSLLLESCFHEKKASSVDKLYTQPHVVRAFENLCFIATLLRSKDKEAEKEEDWKYVAMVLDRLFLILFAIACFLGTVSILLRAPSLYDDAKPIDTRSSHTELAKVLFQ